MSLGDSHCRLLEVEVEVFEVEVDIDRGILSELLKTENVEWNNKRQAQTIKDLVPPVCSSFR